MMNLRRALLEQVAQWDAPTRLGLTIAVVLMVVMAGLSTLGPEPLRAPALLGLGTLFIVAQGIVLWGNRRMVTPFTRAQRHYLAGEFGQAAEILEEQRRLENVDVQELTLLGNTYRQLGQLLESETVLSEALNISPMNHFPLYGFGRTLLVKGAYGEAAEVIQRALNAGAPDIVHVDLAEAWYRQDDADAARAALGAVPDMREPYRQLMVDYMRFRLNGEPLPARDNAAQGLHYWEENARRFSHTPYGAALMRDVDQMRQLIQGV